MSHFTTVKTQIVDKEYLLKALAECGFSTVKEGDNLPLYGYQGDKRAQTADIVVRRKHISPASNDLGFKKTDSGYEIIISEYDVKLLGQNFTNKLMQNYAYHVTKDSLKEQDFTIIEEEVQKDNTIHLTLRRIV
jgi:hypothetical protein